MEGPICWTCLELVLLVAPLPVLGIRDPGGPTSLPSPEFSPSLKVFHTTGTFLPVFGGNAG